jgi:hypothetical protein
VLFWTARRHLVFEAQGFRHFVCFFFVCRKENKGYAVQAHSHSTAVAVPHMVIGVVYSQFELLKITL